MEIDIEIEQQVQRHQTPLLQSAVHHHTALKKTGIVATIGPITQRPEMIKALLEAGMSVARLNGSHNTLDWHAKTIQMIRECDPTIPVLIDLPGRKIRTAMLPEPKAFTTGDLIVFSTDPHLNPLEKIPLNYSELHNDLKPGDIILADDATLKFEVKQILGRDIICQAHCDGAIKSCKGLNIPFIKVNVPLVTERDRRVIQFCIEQKVDFIGISFVESGEHVRQIKDLLGESDIRVISKIENKFGIENLDEIICESDALLIDRGDLGAETRIQSVGILQKKIVSRASAFGIPVIFATEMLHSMIENPAPTKAEISDITNSVLDGAAAVMLSGETAVGKFPVQAVREMSSVIREAELFLDDSIKNITMEVDPTVPNAIGKSVFEIARHLDITKIVCVSNTGYAPKMIARYRLKQPILAVTDTIQKVRKLNLFWGVNAFALPVRFVPDNTQNVITAVRALWEMGHLSDQDRIVTVSARYPYAGSKMNALEIHSVKSLRSLLGWGN